MTSPNSAHTAANLALAQDGLRDGDVITSPSLTNTVEAVHGNGIIRLQDSAYGMTSRNDTATNSPGHCTRTGNNAFTVAGGLCVMDGVLYSFGNGPGSTQAMTIDNTLAYCDTTALTTGQEAVYVVYLCASSNAAHTNARIRIAGGSPVSSTGNVYPPIPDSYLTNPNTVLGAGELNGHALVLATIRCEYNAGGGNDLVNIIEVNDKRHFLSSSARYYTPLVRNNATTSANANSVNRTNDSGVNNDTDLKNVFGAGNDESGDFGGTIGSNRIDTSAMWVSHQRWGVPTATPPVSTDADYGLGIAGGIDSGGTNTPTDVLYLSGQANADQSSAVGGSMYTTRLGSRGVDVATWTGLGTTNWPITAYGDSVFIINVANVGAVLNLVPTGAFPEGHMIDLRISGGSGTLQFNGNTISDDEGWVYDGASWYLIDSSPAVGGLGSSGGSGLVQLSDGAGGFTSDTDLSWDAAGGELTVNGKLTVTGLIDPTGLELDPQSANPGGVAGNTLWLDSGASNRPKIGSNAVMRASDNISELTNDAGFTDAAAAGAAAPVQSVNSATGAVVLDADDLADGATNVMMTATERTKLSGIATGAEVNVNADWNAVSGDAQILNKPSDVTDLSTHSVTELSDVSNAGSGAIITSAERTKLSGVETAATADQDANEVPVTHTPANYTAATADVEAHIVGIDTALASAGGGGTPSGAAGAVQFSDGSAFASDDANLHWDDTNNRLGVGTNAPDADLHVQSAATGNIFVLECTDSGVASGPDISMIRDSSTPADDDFLGRLVFKGRDSGGNLLEYGNIKAQLGDATNGSEGFNMFIQGVVAGTNRPFLGLRANDGLAGASQAEVCVNEHGIDMDFRVESDTKNSALFVRGSDGNVGIGTTSPAQELHVAGGIRQTDVTSAVLVANANGDLVAASNLSDQAYSTTDTTDAAADAYAPAIAAHWNAPAPPGTTAEALDRIAAWIDNYVALYGPTLTPPLTNLP